MEWTTLLEHPQVKALLELAITEDLGDGDITTDAIFASPQRVQAQIISRNPTIVCGVPLGIELLSRFDPQAEVTEAVGEGQRLPRGSRLVAFEADIRAVLKAERCMLNFLMRLCGIANTAHQAVKAVPLDCKAQIFDTRKTTPGWRLLEKMAVRTGGAQNHRIGLFDAILIKDNHIAAAGSITEAVALARKHASGKFLQIEVDTLEQFDEALKTHPDSILLDNFAIQTMELAVERNMRPTLLEVSGGVTLERIPAIARTGVDRISLGAITHSALPADLSLEII
jgi:nicotinate-nucleotide pyrophosphorylase (carboxylating)